MSNVLKGCFLDLFKDFKESSKQVTLVHDNLGPLLGRIIEVGSDYLRLKMLDLEAGSFYNVDLPLHKISAIQTNDEEEINE